MPTMGEPRCGKHVICGRQQCSETGQKGKVRHRRQRPEGDGDIVRDRCLKADGRPMRPFVRTRRAAIALTTGASTTPSGMKGSSSSSRAMMSWSFSPICQAGRMCRWCLRSASLYSIAGAFWPLVGSCAGIRKKAAELIETELDSTSHLNIGVRLMDLIGQLMKENLGLALLAVCCLATVTWNSWSMGQTAHTISAKP